VISIQTYLYLLNGDKENCHQPYLTIIVTTQLQQVVDARVPPIRVTSVCLLVFVLCFFFSLPSPLTPWPSRRQHQVTTICHNPHRSITARRSYCHRNQIVHVINAMNTIYLFYTYTHYWYILFIYYCLAGPLFFFVSIIFKNWPVEILCLNLYLNRFF